VITFVLAVHRIAEIQLRHLLPNPKCSKTSSRKVQDTESKGFCNIDLQQDAWNLAAMQSLAGQAHCSEIIMYAAAFYECTLVVAYKSVQHSS